VAVSVDGPNGVAIEVNSETDFVAKNSEFQEMVRGFAGVALTVESVEGLADADYQGKKISEVLTDKIATIGENLSLRRISKITGDQVVSYIHNAAADGMGAIAVLVALKGNNQEFGRQVAMHIAAANPQALNKDELDPSILEREKSVLTEQARESGKPEQVIEKMIDGRMKKFLSEVTLLGQDFVIDPDLTVEAAAKNSGVEIVGYIRMAVGEGIEKKEEDFAAEVAKAAQG
jgi:elongation factor Ts